MSAFQPFCLTGVSMSAFQRFSMSDVVIQVDHLWKKYRLGVLGTGRLNPELTGRTESTIL
jgi:hypothetical protein